MDKIKIEIDREIYRNGDFRIYAGFDNVKMESVSVKTDGFSLTEGEKILVGHMGTYQGQKSFQCKYEEFDYKSKDAQKNLLKSIKGIGSETAKMIMEKVDDINIYRNDNYPQIKGIGPGTVLLIKEGLQKLDNMETFKELNMILGSNCTANKIKNINEVLSTMENGLEQFKLNPYKILIEHAGFGFKAADKIGLGLGLKLDNKDRIKYLIEHIVKHYTSMGNCYMNKLELLEKLEECKIKGDIKEIIEKNDRLVIEAGKVYTIAMHEAETRIPHLLNKISEKETDIKKLDTYDVSKSIKEFEEINKIKFDKLQVDGIRNIINNKISILTGYAGSGKTSLLKCVLYILEQLSFKLYLTAPTGKASRRMTQATGLKATTVHRFLVDAMESFTRKNAVMIIDEFSMVDTELFYYLLDTMENSSIDFIKLIVVGDPGQLPSVQPGNCLNDLIESDKFNMTKLIKIYRQGKDSNIPEIAAKIRGNEHFDYIQKKDFYCKEILDIEKYIQSIKYFFNYLYEKYDSLDLFYSEVQFIAPTKKGAIGINKVNEILKKEINPGKVDKYFPFNKNDKIMCIKNDRENSIMNGESGRITDVDKMTFTVYYKDLEKYVTYKKDFEIINNFQLSYCSTIHKLQGSEYKYIVLIISQDSIFLDSRLLYTGITRGKQTVILLSNKAITSKVVARNNLLKRNTHLKQRLIDNIQDSK
jgi:exodeoxyribonuclease V alpha subunit